MNGRVEFDEVKRRLRPGDVFQRADHDWKTQNDSKWVGSCPWHDSSSGTCFKVFELSELKWKCHSCGRGGGPLQYVAELENVGSGARGSLKGKDFLRAWEALSRHAGCEGPPDWDGDPGGSGSEKSARKKRRPLQNRSSRTGARQRETSASTSGTGTPAKIRPRTRTDQPGLKVPESELRDVPGLGARAYREDSARGPRRFEEEGLGLPVIYRPLP